MILKGFFFLLVLVHVYFFFISGKAGQNVRLHKDVSFFKDERYYQRRVAHSNFYNVTILSPDSIIVRCLKRKVLLNKPIYLASIILDLSKAHMVKIWYDFIAPAFADVKSLVLNSTDTG